MKLATDKKKNVERGREKEKKVEKNKNLEKEKNVEKEKNKNWKRVKLCLEVKGERELSHLSSGSSRFSPRFNVKIRSTFSTNSH